MDEKCCCHLVLPDGSKVAIKDSVARELVNTLKDSVDNYDSLIAEHGNSIEELKTEQDRLDRVQVLMQASLSKKMNSVQTDTAYTYVYGYDKSGDSSIRVSSGGGNNTIPLRDGSGLFYVGSENNDPTEPRHPVNKAYLDRRLSSIDVSDIAVVKKLNPEVYDLNTITGATDGFTIVNHLDGYSTSLSYLLPLGTIPEGLYIAKTTMIRDTGALFSVNTSLVYYLPNGGFSVFYDTHYSDVFRVDFNWNAGGERFQIWVDQALDKDTFYRSYKYKVELLRIV